MRQMTRDRYGRIKSIVQELIDLPIARRSEVLDSHCGDDTEFRDEVEAFLLHFDTPAIDLELASSSIEALLGDACATPDERETIPERIGPYRVLRLLGEGGMGVVYLAEQEQPRRTVAVKIIRPGFTTPPLLRRFEHEGHVLGRLQHPGIASIYSAGVADTDFGRQPYLVIEYIDGQPLLEYVQSRGLSTDERLKLFLHISEAIEHAHQKGIIHRDLKPANILVDQFGQPKVLDFGVARAADPEVRVTTIAGRDGQLIGTLPYMSPEQTSGDPGEVDTRSDVYSLGVILFELLTSRLPYDFTSLNMADIARVIREREPDRLGRVNREFRGDLETIVAKALEKTKSRRYQSAREFAQDVERLLADEPIMARPAGRLYRFQKFCRRNTITVAAAALVLLAITIGTIATGLSLIRALAAEELAVQRLTQVQREAAKAQAVNQFLQTMLASIDPRESNNPDVTMRTILEAAAARITAGETSDDPEVQAAILHTLGVTYRALTAYPEARDFLTEALEIRLDTFGREHLDTAHSMNELAEVYREVGDLERAEELCLEALVVRRALLVDDHHDVAVSLNNLALVRKYQGHLEESEQLNIEALEMRRRLYGNEHIDVVASLNNLSLTSFQLRRDFAASEAMLREIIEILWALYPDGHVYTSNSLDNLATLLSSQGRYAEAEVAARQSLEMRMAILPPNHELLAEGMSNLGIILRRMNQLEEAEELYLQSLAIRVERWGEHHPAVATTLHNLGTMLHAQGRMTEAVEILTHALDIRLDVLSPNNSLTALTANNLSLAHIALREFHRAQELLEMAIDMHRAREDGRHPLVALAMHNIASIQRELGNLHEAELLYRDALKRRIDLFGPQHPTVSETLNSLSVVLRDLDRDDEAFDACNEALAIRQAISGENVPATFIVRMNLAQQLLDRGHADEAAATIEPILAEWRKSLAPGHVNIMASAFVLGRALTELGETHDAQALLLDVLDARLDALPLDHWRIGEARGALGRCSLVHGQMDDAKAHLLAGYEIVANDPASPLRVRRQIAAWLAEVYEQLGHPEHAAAWSELAGQI